MFVGEFYIKWYKEKKFETSTIAGHSWQTLCEWEYTKLVTIWEGLLYLISSGVKQYKPVLFSD